jgi:UTP--glucose-1-phosphate uridylyltransferase
MHNNAHIRTAVIPAGGWGTRVLPATVVVPKPLLPAYQKPTVQLTVEEAVAAGIEQIIFVTTANQRGLIEAHFTPPRELVARKGHTSELKDLLRLREQISIKVVDQGEARGLGHAVLRTADAVGDEPFVVMLPDDLVDPATPCLPRMIKVFERNQGSVLSLFEVPRAQVSSFGVVAGAWIDEKAGTFQVTDMVEKPEPTKAPSHWAVAGRYVLTPDIFAILQKTGPGKGGEIQLTDALRQQALASHCYGARLDGTRYDTGTPMGLLTTAIAYALKDPTAASELRAYLRTIR